MKKFLAAIAIALTAAFGFAAPGLAQPVPYPPQLSITVVINGTTTTITITGCQLGETVHIVVTGPGGTVTVDVTCTGGGGTAALPMQTAGGSASASIATPTVPGTYTITANGLTSGFGGTQAFTVAQTPTTTTIAPTTTAASGGGGGGGGGALPTTGSDGTPTLWIGGTAVLLGAGLVGVAWRRRRPTAA